MPPPPGPPTAERLVAPLREHPQRSAILCDIDGTLAPIVPRPEEAAVPPAARSVLADLSHLYAVVACVSGRRAVAAREMVGVDSLLYFGNHGLERLEPGAETPVLAAGIAPFADRVRELAAERFTPELEQLGVTLEDKDAIQSFHYRRATDEGKARAQLNEVANAAVDMGLHPRWGRKVLEIRPTDGVDKGTAVAAAVEGRGLAYALFGGDDTTDVDAFRRLEALAAEGDLESVICVGVASAETPPSLVEEADVMVEGTDGFLRVLETLTDQAR
jgi:trehalose 6-phosphate phosphatase